MKLRKLFSGLLLASTLALGVGVALSASQNKSVVKAEAASSTMVSGTRVFIQDQTTSDWTNNGSGRDAIMHVYSVTFVKNSGYSSLADVKLNDLYATSFSTDGSTYMNIRMKWVSGPNQQFEAILPWYIASFTTEFYATKDNQDRYVYWDGTNNKISKSCSLGDNCLVYLYGKNNWSGNNLYIQDSTPAYGKNYTYEFNGIKSGEHMYLNTEDLTGWDGSGAKLAVLFERSNVNKNGGWSSQYHNINRTSMDVVFMWKVNGSGNDHLFECIVPQYNGQDVYWSMVQGYRFNSVATSPSKDTNVWNTTGEQFYNGDDSDCNMLWVNAATGGSWSGGGYLRNDKTISSSTRAGYFGTYFLDQVKCTGEGSIKDESNWNAPKDEYELRMSLSVRGKIWETVAAETGTNLVQAMYRYDYIVFKKGYYGDYIGRASNTDGKAFTSSGSVSLVSISTNNTQIIPVVIVSVVSISAIAAYFLFRRKNENI